MGIVGALFMTWQPAILSAGMALASLSWPGPGRSRRRDPAGTKRQVKYRGRQPPYGRNNRPCRWCRVSDCRRGRVVKAGEAHGGAKAYPHRWLNRHALMSHLFGAVIVALVIDIAASLLN